MNRSEMQHIASAADFRVIFGVSRETIERLEGYSELLRTWQKAINLVAPSTVDHLWHRHFADSAQVLGCAPKTRPLSWVDFGSGAGFPGLVVAIILAETRGNRVTLIESDAKKCAFMREVVRKTGISGSVTVDIVTERIERAAVSSKVGVVDVISARALASLDQLFAYSEPVFGQKTVGIFPKGRDVKVELAAARLIWDFEFELVPSITEADAGVCVVRALKRRVPG